MAPTTNDGPGAFRRITAPRRQWVGQGLNRQLVACDDMEAGTFPTPTESSLRPPSQLDRDRPFRTLSPVCLWDEVPLLRPPPAKGPKHHGALYRQGTASRTAEERPGSRLTAPWQERAVSPASRRSRTAPPGGGEDDRPSVSTATHARSAWRVRRTSPLGGATPLLPRDVSGDELSSLPSSNRFEARRQHLAAMHRSAAAPPTPASPHADTGAVVLYQRPRPVRSAGPQRTPNAPSSVASSRRPRPDPGSAAWSPQSAGQQPAGASPGRRRWNTSWTQDLEDRLARHGTPDRDSPVGLIRRVPLASDNQLIRRVPLHEDLHSPLHYHSPERPFAPSPPHPGHRPRGDPETASLRSRDRHSSIGTQPPRMGPAARLKSKYLPQEGPPSVAGSMLSAQRRREYLSPPLPDKFAWTNERAASIVSETKHAKGTVSRARSPIRAPGDRTGTNFCDVCGAEYLRTTSQFCSECGSERVAVVWTSRDR